MVRGGAEVPLGRLAQQQVNAPRGQKQTMHGGGTPATLPSYHVHACLRKAGPRNQTRRCARVVQFPRSLSPYLKLTSLALRSVVAAAATRRISGLARQVGRVLGLVCCTHDDFPCDVPVDSGRRHCRATRSCWHRHGLDRIGLTWLLVVFFDWQALPTSSRWTEALAEKCSY